MTTTAAELRGRERVVLVARCSEGGAALAMLVPEAEQDLPPRSPLCGASDDMLLDHAFTGHAGAVAAFLSDAVATRSGHEIAEFVPNEE